MMLFHPFPAFVGLLAKDTAAVLSMIMLLDSWPTKIREKLFWRFVFNGQPDNKNNFDTLSSLKSNMTFFKRLWYKVPYYTLDLA